MADEEALAVVVGVDEPAGDAVGVVRADLGGGGVEHVDAPHLNLEFVGSDGADFDVGFSEYDEEVGFVGAFEGVGHVEIGVHPGFEHLDAAEFGEFGGVGVVVEGAGDDHVEAGVSGFPGGLHQVGAGDGAEFRADEDARPAVGGAVVVVGLGADRFAGPAAEGAEGDAVVLG